MPEVQRRQVEEIDNKDEFSPDEVSTNEQHDEGKLQEIVENEMASNTSSSIDIFGIVGEKVPDVSNLQEEEDNPNIPVSTYLAGSEWWINYQ